jgi:hypothetical protein
MPAVRGEPSARQSVWAASESFEQLGNLAQAAVLTLPLLLLHVDRYWYVRVPVIALGLSGLIFPRVRHSPAFWFTLTSFLAAGIVNNWFAVDNHKYLLCYWCLALFLCLRSPDGENALALSARRLVGLTFLFAVSWKIASRDFLSGDFFDFAFLFDSRFSSRLAVLGLVEANQIDVNLAALRALTSVDASMTSARLVLTPDLHRLSMLFTGWAIVIEGLVAATFLAPVGWKWSRVRDAFLLVFVTTTYAFAPVTGFGWLLVTMGFIQCERDRRGLRRWYLAALFLVQAFRLPWPQLLALVQPIA